MPDFEIVIAPVDESKPVPEGSRCQEASTMSYAKYVPCRAPATTIVRHDRDRRSYLMCDPCADHNLKNRGGKLVSTVSEEIAIRYGPLRPCPFCGGDVLESGTRGGEQYVDCRNCKVVVCFRGRGWLPEVWNRRELVPKP